MGFTKRTIVRIDCKRDIETICEQLRDAFEALEDRFGEQINEEGVFTGNLPQGVKAPGCDGVLHDITQMVSSQIQLENDGWGQKAKQTIYSQPPGPGIASPEGICYNHAGSLFIEIQDGSGDGTVNVWGAADYTLTGAIVAQSPLGTITDAELDLPSARATFTEDNEFLLMMTQGPGGATGRQVVSIDVTTPSAPVIADRLNVDAITSGEWRDLVWDEANRILWFCDASTLDNVVGAEVDGNGNMTLINFIDNVHINRARSLDLSDNGDFLYVGNTGQIAIIDISNPFAPSWDNTATWPAGSGVNINRLAHQGANMGAIGSVASPADVYSITIDTPQNGLTFNNKITLSVGDSFGSNRGYTLIGNQWGNITRPEAAPTYFMLIDITAPTPVEDEAIVVNAVGNTASRYTFPAINVFAMSTIPPNQPGFAQYLEKWAAGNIWGDPSDIDNCADFNGWKGAYFQSGAPQGIPPFIVNSTTLVVNLNADYLDGLHASEIEDNAVSRAHDEWLFWERINGA
jgi:hypothetical protein